MTLLVPNIGENRMLQNSVNKLAAENLVLRLFTNNITPAESDTDLTYTEASGNGYSAITLTGSSWNAPSEGDPTSIDFAQQTFTFTGALGNVYGYYLTEVTSGKLRLAERFADAPYNIQNNGDQIKITPQLTLE